MRCPACRSPQPDDARSCSVCGKTLVTEPEPAGGDTLGASLPASAVEVADSTLEFAPAAALREGMVFAGRYEIQAVIGRGGMGTVYRARDRHLEEIVALKLILPQLVPMGGILERFKHEIRLARQLSHPNIIKVYDLGQYDDVTYLSMEHLEGADLRQLIQEQGPLPIERAVEIGKQVCAGLAFAHESGVIHRDIKPHNIFLTKRGRVKLVDFGLAKAIDVSQVSMTGQAIGTPAYMSPEQAVHEEGRPVDHRTDLYSLGVVLFQMFTGQVPFRGTSAVEVALAHVQKQPPRPREFRPDLPAHLEQVVLKAMSKDREYRYSSALEIASDLGGETRLWESAAQVKGVTQPMQRKRPDAPHEGPAIDTSRAGPGGEWAPVLGDRGESTVVENAAQSGGKGVAAWAVPVVLAVAVAAGLGAYRLHLGPFAKPDQVAMKGGGTEAGRSPGPSDTAGPVAPVGEGTASPASPAERPPSPETAPPPSRPPENVAPSPVAPAKPATDPREPASKAAPPAPPPAAPPSEAERETAKVTDAKDANRTKVAFGEPPPAEKPREKGAAGGNDAKGPKDAVSPDAATDAKAAKDGKDAKAAVEPPVAAKDIVQDGNSTTVSAKLLASLPKGTKVTDLELRKLACQGGDGEVCHDLAALFEEGSAAHGVGADTGQAASYYKRSCELGTGEGCIDGGMLLEQTGDGLGAAGLYEKGCRIHKPQACFNLAKMLKDGDGVGAEPMRAALLYRQSCEEGLAAGCTSLGILYEDGVGVENSMSLALDLYERGCKGGSVAGCTNLGRLYQGARGVPEDMVKAGEYYDRACQKANSEACFNLGRLTEKGLGRPADPSAAFALYEKACKKGNTTACAAADRLGGQ